MLYDKFAYYKDRVKEDGEMHASVVDVDDTVLNLDGERTQHKLAVSREDIYLKNFRELLKQWFMGNIDDRKLLEFVLNYGLSDGYKDVEIEYRETYGK